MTRVPHALVLALGVAGAMAGCGHELVSPPVSAGAAKPDLVCTEQLTTAVTLAGSGFAPAIEQGLNTSKLVLPKVVLTRTEDLSGAAATGTFQIPDDPLHPETSRLHWSNKSDMTMQVFPELQLTPGLYDVTVTNPDGTHTATSKGSLAAVPRPTVSAVAPDLLCDAEEDQTVVLTGTDFVSVASTLPVVHMGSQSFTATKLDGCKPVPGTHAEGDIEDCTSATFIIPKGTFTPGAYPVTVTNPAPAGCVSSDKITLTVVPPPSVATVVPDLACDAEGDQTVQVNGSGLLLTGSTLPAVTIGSHTFTPTSSSGCMTVPGMFREGVVQECTALTLTVPKGTFDPGAYAVTVKNPAPADCVSQEMVDLTIVPPPTVSTVVADLVCDAEGDQTVTVNGTGLLQTGSTLPAVTIGSQTFVPTGSAGCAPVPGTFREGVVQECTSLTLTIPAGTFDPGAYSVSVKNPAPADCVSQEAVSLTIVPPPTVSNIVTDLACDAQGDQPMVVNGTGFLSVGTTLPVVTLGTQTFQAIAADGCMSVPGTFAEGAAAECTSLQITVPQGALSAGDYAVAVTNPMPASCVSLDMVRLHIAPPPMLTSAQPVAVCDAQNDQAVTLTGLNFLQVGSLLPSVTIGGQVATVASASGCTLIGGELAEGVVQECTALNVTVAKGAFTQGTYPIAITNPMPASCSTMEMVSLNIDAPPSVNNVSPGALCQGGGTVTVSGAGFLPGATVSLQAAGNPTLSSETLSLNGNQISVRTSGGGQLGTSYDVVVDNGDGCTATAPQHVTIVPGPVAFFADPDVVYNGINTQVTVYATTLQWPITAQLVSTGQTSPTKPLQSWQVPGHPNRAQVVIPSNTDPGTYDIIISDATSCSTVLPQAITVTSALSVSLKSVIPPFGDTKTQTDVTILRDTTALAPADHAFVATPRVFLNPSNPLPNDIAIQLASVSFTDQNTLTAVVPPNEPVHQYDLIVVNPDGTVGYLANAFTVQSVPPPTISTVTPSSLVQATGQVVKIAGQNFNGSTVSLNCRDANGLPLPSPSVSVGSDTCDASQNCTQTATIDASALSAGSICVLRETNSDNSYFDFSALGVTTSSLNLSSPHNGVSMNVGRRGLVAASGNATGAARFIYAIGGDGGSAAANMPYSSVEFASVDLFGNMGQWQVATNSLNTARSFAGGVSVGRYVYVLGGTDGTSSLTTAERAEILDPLETPLLDVDDMIPNATGLDAGYWMYRVSATFDSSDLDNPGGESLPSDEVIVKVPSFQGKKIEVVLKWSAPVDRTNAVVPHVSGYRIYRTPVVNGASGSEVLIGTTGSSSALTFTDDGKAPQGTATPLPLGSLGVWKQLPSMSVGRNGVAAAAAFDPSDPTKFYVYALLGLNGTTALTSYEYLPVTIGTNGHQTFGTWTAGAQQSGTGRWALNAWTADSTVSSAIMAPSTYVYLGGGLLANGSTTGKIEAGLVQPGGDLGTISDTPKDFSSAVAGYGVCAANDQLFAIGGGSPGSPTSKIISATITTPAPALANGAWNAGGTATLNESRFALGTTVQSAFIFALGGETATSVASKTTEFVIW